MEKEQPMRRRNLLRIVTIAGICALGGSVRRSDGGPGTTVDGPAAFARLKGLEGTWTAPAADGRQATTTFELTAGGTVLVERYMNPALPGGGHMMTAYHLDGSALVLTHYCIANNQPTLRATAFDAATGQLQFEFVSARNLATPGAGHMRRAKYRLQDRDHFVTDWEFFENGKKKLTESETFTRSK
jgi:hypothetical protein